MNGEVKRAYAYFKAQHPESILLFRVKDSYVAYFEDAESVSKILAGSNLKFSTSSQTVSFPSDQVYDYMSFIGDSGVAIRLVEQRNADGEFDIPDVTQIQNDIEADY